MNTTSRIKRFIVLAALAWATLTPARAWIFQETPDKAVTVHYRLAVAAGVSTSTVLVDLSDITNFPHKDTGEITIDQIHVDIDKLAASTVTVQMGVVNYVDTSTGSVTWFWSREDAKNVSNTDTSPFHPFYPLGIRCRVNPNGYGVDGATPYVLSSDKTSGSTTYQTDVNLPNPAGVLGAPGVGDIILRVVNSDGTNGVTITADLMYHSNGR